MGQGYDNPKVKAGLMRWAKRRKTRDIAESLSDKDVEDPQALAATIRREALGDAEFKRHQSAARKK